MVFKPNKCILYKYEMFRVDVCSVLLSLSDAYFKFVNYVSHEVRYLTFMFMSYTSWL
jgi:hypothetical protein